MAHVQFRLYVARILLVLLGLAGIAGYLESLRRYAVGSSGPVDFLHGAWHPVEGNVLAISWYVAAMVILLALLWRLTARRDRAASPSAVGPEAEWDLLGPALVSSESLEPAALAGVATPAR
jgi:hypothetical protein